EDFDPVAVDPLDIVAVIGHQYAPHVVRVVNDVGIRSSRRHQHPIDIAMTAEELNHALQYIWCADVKAQLGLGWLFSSLLNAGHMGAASPLRCSFCPRSLYFPHTSVSTTAR